MNEYIYLSHFTPKFFWFQDFLANNSWQLFKLHLQMTICWPTLGWHGAESYKGKANDGNWGWQNWVICLTLHIQWGGRTANQSFCFCHTNPAFHGFKRSLLVSSHFGIITFYYHLIPLFLQGYKNIHTFLQPLLYTEYNRKPAADCFLWSSHNPCIYFLALPGVCSATCPSSGVTSSRKSSLSPSSSLLTSPSTYLP